MQEQIVCKQQIREYSELGWIGKCCFHFCFKSIRLFWADMVYCLWISWLGG